MDIDFVLIWVDSSDEKWRQKKTKYDKNPKKNDDVRFRDWEVLKYWFRAVERFAPWVHKIFFITDNQCPPWLNSAHPQIEMVDHKDYIPERFLPTFNSNCIEINFHRINRLTEHFVAFNDDMFINQPISPSYFFKEGKPCVATLEHIFDGSAYSSRNKDWGISLTDWMNTQVLNAHFNRLEVTKAKPKGWYGSYLGIKYQLQALILKWTHRKEFQHFYTPHNEKALLKSTFEEIWELEPELMNNTCTRFREITNLNIYLMRYWQIVKNNFYPTEELSKKKVVQINNENIDIIEKLMFDKRIQSLCLNDSTDCDYKSYKSLKKKIIALFEKKFPNKSKFEK